MDLFYVEFVSLYVPQDLPAGINSTGLISQAMSYDPTAQPQSDRRVSVTARAPPASALPLRAVTALTSRPKRLYSSQPPASADDDHDDDDGDGSSAGFRAAMALCDQSNKEGVENSLSQSNSQRDHRPVSTSTRPPAICELEPTFPLPLRSPLLKQSHSEVCNRSAHICLT